MNADRVAKTTGKKGVNRVGYGLVIINLQKTPYDEISNLRIFSTLDNAMILLLQELNLKLPQKLTVFENPLKW